MIWKSCKKFTAISEKWSGKVWNFCLDCGFDRLQWNQVCSLSLESVRLELCFLGHPTLSLSSQTWLWDLLLQVTKFCFVRFIITCQFWCWRV